MLRHGAASRWLPPTDTGTGSGSGSGSGSGTTLRFDYFASGQLPSASGRKACSAGMVVRSL